MQILGLLGMYFDAAVVFVTNSSLLFRLAKAILCGCLLTTPLTYYRGTFIKDVRFLGRYVSQAKSDKIGQGR